MRLFVAIELDQQVADRLIEVSEELKKRVARRAPAARATWVSRERLHLTVRFIGDVDESRADAIRAQLTPPLETEAFDLTFEGAGAFPPKGPPRVLWAGVTGGADDAIAVEREVSARLLTCGVEAESRPYRPHLTLARIREAGGLRVSGLFDGLQGVIGTTPVAAITLFQSRLSPKGPTYVPLQSTTLAWKK